MLLLRKVVFPAVVNSGDAAAFLFPCGWFSFRKCGVWFYFQTCVAVLFGAEFLLSLWVLFFCCVGVYAIWCNQWVVKSSPLPYHFVSDSQPPTPTTGPPSRRQPHPRGSCGPRNTSTHPMGSPTQGRPASLHKFGFCAFDWKHMVIGDIFFEYLPGCVMSSSQSKLYRPLVIFLLSTPHSVIFGAPEFRRFFVWLKNNLRIFVRCPF